MQNIVRKISFIFVILFFGSLQVLGFQVSKNLQKADSLYNAQQFLEASLHYEAVVKHEHLVSQDVLFKLIQVSEKQKDTLNNLLYTSMLNKYFPDFDRIDQLHSQTDDYSLERYYSDPLSLFDLWWRAYRSYIWYSVLVLLFLSVVVGIVLYLRSRTAWRGAFGLALFFGVLLVLANSVRDVVNRPMHYIAPKQAEFRTAPSYAAPVHQAAIKPGEMLRLLQKEGPWLQLTTQNDTLFVRQKENPFLF